MTIGEATMRAVLVLALVTTLSGCYSVRHRNDNVDAVANADKSASKVSKRKTPKQVLPTGLGGDTEHKAYTDTPR